MGFTDLMTSGRGPGVIGMLLALVVLLGFGVLFMFAMDEGFQGGERSIESVISQQAKDIESYENMVASGNARLAAGPGRAAAVTRLGQTRNDSRALADQRTRLESESATIKQEIERQSRELEDYKDEYRAHVRNKAKGTTLARLETTDGTVFKEVEIREVTPIGMQIRHSNGFKRIKFEELSAEMKDYYQFDPDQKHEALAAEQQVRAHHEAAVAAVNREAEAAMAVRRAADQEAAVAKARQEIAAKEAQVAALRREISGLEGDIARDEAAAASARSAGRMYLSKAGSIRGRMRGKQNQMATLQGEIGRLKSKL